MALLTVKARKKRFEFLGLKYNKTGIKTLQKKYFKDGDLVDGIYGVQTDILLRHVYNVKKYTKNFTPEEFKCECGGRYCNGYPTFMKRVELKNLQAIRDHYKQPMTVTCGVRCKKYNDSLAGSVPNSGHLRGYACDFSQFGVTTNLSDRKASIKWMKTLPNTEYIYGDGINSYGYSVYAPYMGDAMHYETHKPPKSEKSPAKKSKKKVDIGAPYRSKKVILGQASSNEKRTLSGGKAGDQAREVATANYYKGGWKYVFRARDKETRLKLAQAMLDACNNHNIGYDTSKPDRYTAWDLAEKNGHKIAKINKKCETTCSQLVSMCMRAVGISKKYAQRHYDIVTMTRVLPKCNDFMIFKDRAHTASSKYLQPGDILLSSHHTVIIVKSPNSPVIKK